MFKSKLSKVIVSLLRRIAGVTRSGAKRLMRAMLQTLMAMGRRARLPMAGFVLPTVTMVLLVVILLTVAITLRSFDRANTARNVRVNQQVLAAATPALDRAKAKIQFVLYEDPQRPTSTPSDAELYRMMSENTGTSDLYKFGDEERLILKYPVNGTSLTNANNPKLPPVQNSGAGIVESEAINTAWRYPVDTNNDGKFDTFTLYGIFFRNPPLDATSLEVARARKPLDARTPPMSLGVLEPACAAAGAGDNVATLVGDSGWYKLDGKLSKSFFVYTVNVPIKDPAEAAALGANYQAFTGTSSISALEYQQDQSRIPLSNNAVVYEDDLDISPGVSLNLNGRILTNSNLLVTGVNNPRDVKLFEVSSKGSCFYDQENSRIQVAGNVVNGWAGNTNSNPAVVHLFKTKASAEQPDATPEVLINPTNQSAPTNTSLDVLYNGNAYSRRLNALVEGQMSKPETDDPVSVYRLVNPPAGSTQQPLSRSNALESYFKERLRKVPFKEAPLGSDGGVADPAVTPYTAYLQESGDRLRPIDAWSLPTTGNAQVGSATGPTGLTLDLTKLPSRNPEKIESEENLGERVLVGNNLPAQRWDATQSKFVGAADPQDVGGPTPWTGGEPGRTRKSQVTKIADVGATDRGNGWGETPGSATPPFRDGFWEAAAAQTPRNPLDGTGGLRVITSGGVYDRTYSFLPPPRWTDADGPKQGPASVAIGPTPSTTYDDPATAQEENYPVVWPDTMPMSPLGPGSQVYNNNSPTGGWEAWPAGATADGTGLDPITVASTTLIPGIKEEAATARKFAKGDLRMRATAVYHYADNGYNPDAITGTAQPDQKPYACVSSYYDPSNAFTARNITSLVGNGLPADVSGQGGAAPYVARQAATLGSPQAFIGSNNGITYTPNKARPRPGRSNVGAGGLLTGGDPVLDIQASLVFPDGRFANGPLRTALQVPETARTLAQKAAIDSTYCALDILSRAIAPNRNLIPHGAIQEVAFLSGREIKAIERDNVATPNVNEAFTLSGPVPLTNTTRLKVNYNQPLEERQPLEIRATQLDIKALRGEKDKPVAGEWLLPNSGIIYASRDDALPDRSDRTGTPATGLDEATSKRVSPSDSTLDPTRKPNGIVLINGDFLFRGGNTPTGVTTVADVVKEKGLTLVSNLPVYIQGRFNAHGRIPPAPVGGPPPAFTEVEEFKTTVNSTWSNFYGRTKDDLDSNFACRQGDPRLPSCGGDYWRPANVLADAVTLLSAKYRFGFRNEGDFDLRNNAGAEAVLRRRQRGFFNNNFVTNGLSSGAFLANGNLKAPADAIAVTDATYRSTTTPPPVQITSSYFNNFVTPVQRRGLLPEYLMEVCKKLPVSECGDADWFVDLTPGSERTAFQAVPAGAATAYVAPAAGASFQAGSTFDPPLPALQRFPRRVAFARNASNQLLTPATPQPLAITGGATIAPVTPGTNPPAPIAARANSLWFAGGAGTPVYNNSSPLYMVNTGVANARDGSNTPLPALLAGATPEPPVLPLQGTQPLLLPFSQIRDVAATPPATQGGQTARNTGWIARAENTTFNLVIAAGDTPSQNLNGTVGDFNGGLQNLPRFLESWNAGTDATNIKGSFIQLNRSAFSTAPYLSILGGTPLGSTPADKIVSLFDRLNPPTTSLVIPVIYNVDGAGDIPYFSPPKRNWGYDVGLLPQPPDLFTQKFTTPPSTSQPAEFFREVPRNDPWVKTLMCGVKEDGGSPATSSIAPTECASFPY
ncbi:hormogonium polysaccharide biosynthesis protein HpsA [Microcoleus sp. AT3-A2]|uniref:hormogonium polysaccharide biosynthesis protein HpsA n=1 Tax=Microcoleus sp. AT3-A2 TaxID=2818610 RepID=UPI002FD53CAC